MKLFTKKGILQKMIISILVIMILVNFIKPTYSNASNGAADVGGVLLSPVVDLACSIGDVVINLLQRCMMGDWGTSSPNFSLNAFLMEASDYFNASDYVKPDGDINEKVNPDDFTKGWLWNKGEYYIPVATYSPEQIFAGNVAGLDINFINPNKYQKTDGTEVESSAAKLQPIISSWYIALRNLSVVGLLSILVYVGIRIVISSTASDKAKYKQMFIDWIIALCLVFFMHYIMSFIITLTESVCTAIGGNGQTSYIIYDETQEKSFSTNLLGAARYKTQYKDMGLKLTYLIFYLALVIYTVIFTYFYLKRLLMMAFLTLIAPLVALTYPIDKMGDGKAQAFDSWLKEYAFNALIQPFHLIIYTVFVTSAMQLASSNIIYTIAALGFILPAEKILRNFFGFNKAGAGTLGALSGFTAGSLASKFLSGKGGKGGKGQLQVGKSEGENDNLPIFVKKHDVGQIDDGNIRNTSNNPQETNTKGEERFAGDERMAEIEGEDYNYTSNPEWMELNEQREREMARKETAEGQDTETQQQERPQNRAEKSQLDEKVNKKTGIKEGLRNLARYHTITPKNIAKGTGKAIKGVTKFGTRTAFKAAYGTIPAAIALASGGGAAGAIAAFTTGSSLGARAAERTISAVSGAPKAVRKEIDVFNGNTNLREKNDIKEFKRNGNNVQYVKDMMAKENGGVIPSDKEVKNRMDSLDPYISEGLTDIKDMLKAQKAEQYGVSSKQAAIIAAIGKEKGINADILNDDKKCAARTLNLKQEFVNKGKTEAEATKLADHTINILKVQNGVANNLGKPSIKK